MRTRRTWGRLLAALAVALVAAVGFAPRAAWAADVSTENELATALATNGGDTLTLTDSVELTATATVSGSKTLDLNGHDITGSIETLISVPAGAALTIQDDSAEPGQISGGTTRAVLVNGELTLAGGTVDSDGGQAVLVNGEGSKLAMTGGAIHGSNEALRGQWATIDISGGVISTDEQASESGPLVLLATDATLSGDARIEGYYGVTLFNITEAGAVDNDETSDPSTFTMNGGAIDCYVFAISGNNMQSATCSTTINDGTITAEDTAIYWPMEGALTVNGGNITGGNAIEAKMGTINIKGGTLRGTVESGFAYSGDGSASDGSAIKVVGQLYGGSEGQFIKDSSLTVNITGGTLESASGNAMTVYVDDVESAYGGGSLTATVNVSADATLVPAEGNDGLRATSVSDFTLTETGAETGNTTINNPELASAAVVANGKTQTSASTSQNGNTLYTSVERAIVSATSADVAPDGGATITLLRDVEEDVTVPDGASVTLNLGEHTLTGSVENNGSLALAGTGEIVGQVTGNNPTGGDGVTVTVARIDNQGYPTIEAALAAAKPGQTVALVTDVSLSQRLAISTSNVTLDLNGYTVSSSEDFAVSADPAMNNLVSIDGATGVTIKNGSIVAGSKNRSTLNLFDAKDVVLEGLTLDHAAGAAGAPLIVGSSTATVSGSLNVVTGGGSWYGINLDSSVSAGGDPASLAFTGDAAVSFSGDKSVGIYVENSAGVDAAGLVVSFEPGATLSSDIDSFVPIVVAGSVDATIKNPENAGIGIGSDGTYHVHKADVERKNAVEATCTKTGYTGDVVCSVCGDVLEAGKVTEALGHDWNEWTVTKQPTCTEDGAESRTCKRGDAQEARKIPATGHQLVKHERVEPTTDRDGNIEYYECEACGALFYDEKGEKPISALDATVLPARGEVFTVTFVYGNGQEDYTLEIADGKLLLEPKTPTREGYKFAGWFLTNEGGKLSDEYDFSKPVTGDLTLYAGWLAVDAEGDETVDNDQQLAQTGDVVSFVPAVVAGAAGLAAAAGAVTLRRRSK